MKYHEYRELIKKKMLMIGLTVGTATMMTACSFSFEDTSSNDVVYYSQEVVPISENDFKEVGTMIDECDLTSESEVAQLQENIMEWSSDVEKTYECSFVECTLVRVVDGDTIVVNISNEEYTVRLIGIDTPESVASESYLEATGKENCEEGLLASDYTKQLLEGCNILYLDKDISDVDRYGRLLRYVWVNIPSDCNNIEEIRSKMLNGMLLDKGIAVMATYPPDVKYVDAFKQLNETETNFDFDDEDMER